MFTQSQLNNLTTDEKLRYGVSLGDDDIEYIEAEAAESRADDLAKAYEASEYFIYDVMQLLDNAPKTKRELIAAIKALATNYKIEV